MKYMIQNKPFWAVFGTQFFGAYNDNFLRTAFATLVTYHLVSYTDTEQSLFVSAAFGLFTLPFFLFSPLAGQIADRFDKSLVIRWVKGAEIFIILLTSYGLTTQNPFFLLGALFCMGIHSAFFGPAKYSILPDLLPEKHLLRANGFMEAGTFLAIMLGTLLGAFLVLLKIPYILISFQLFIFALLGFGISWFIPAIPRRAPRLKIRLLWWGEVVHLYRYARKDTRVFKSIISIAWFWLVGAVLIAQLPSFAKSVLKVEEAVFIFLLLLFTLGIGLGSILCNYLLKGEITTKYIPLLAGVMVIFLFDVASYTSPLASHMQGILAFLTSYKGLRLTFDILMLSFLGGLFIVPLYAYIQTHVVPSRRSQVIAFSNIMNAGFMVFASIASFCLLKLSFSIPTLFFLTAIGQIFITLYIFRILPEALFRKTLHTILKALFGLEVKGLENYQKAGERVILVANHTSFIDALILAAVLPEKPLFAINSFTAERWWVRPFLVLARVFPLDPLHPYHLRAVIDEAKKGHKVLIFPEGRLTLTGGLMKIYEGPGLVAEKAEASILPIRIEGAQYTFFSRLKGQVRRRFFPKISVTILPALSLSVDPEIKGRARRKKISEKLYDTMAKMMFETSPIHKTLFSSLLECPKAYGASTPVLQDYSLVTLTYDSLFLRLFTLARLLKRKLKRNQNPVGLLLPNAHGLVVSFWALQAIGRVPALLNYASGQRALLKVCEVANITNIITSKNFIEKARLEETIAALKAQKIRILYLEDEVKHISLLDKAWGMIGRFVPQLLYKPRQTPDDPCVILFTSGSEGDPKGVVLSHTNIQANRYQLSSVVDFNGKDRVLNALPLFHGFGLTAGMILPLLSGIKTFHYLSPLHYRNVAELIYDMGATILFGTDTFLSGYARVAHVYDFHSLRYVFAGAEKLKETTQSLWFEKFGIRILEGYGTTETGPVLAVNTMMHYKQGTVGQFLPGIHHRFDSVEGIKEGGRLFVKGPNIMKGYLVKGNKDELLSPPDGWYDTGDIARLDDEGYLTLLGRAKRFAKVGGEMVSLGSVEDAVLRLWPEDHHAVLAEEDPKKGEKLILYTTHSHAARSDLVRFWKEEGLSELSIPKEVKVLPSLPLLGTGKVDYKALSEKV